MFGKKADFGDVVHLKSLAQGLVRQGTIIEIKSNLPIHMRPKSSERSDGEVEEI